MGFYHNSTIATGGGKEQMIIHGQRIENEIVFVVTFRYVVDIEYETYVSISEQIITLPRNWTT